MSLSYDLATFLADYLPVVWTCRVFGWLSPCRMNLPRFWLITSLSYELAAFLADYLPVVWTCRVFGWLSPRRMNLPRFWLIMSPAVWTCRVLGWLCHLPYELAAFLADYVTCRMILDLGYWILYLGYWILDLGSRVFKKDPRPKLYCLLYIALKHLRFLWKYMAKGGPRAERAS